MLDYFRYDYFSSLSRRVRLRFRFRFSPAYFLLLFLISSIFSQFRFLLIFDDALGNGTTQQNSHTVNVAES